MNNLTSFYYHDAIIRTQYDDNGEPLFCAKDICDVLGYVNASKAVADHVDQEDITKRYTLTNGGNQSISYVNESGLYALIFGSKLESAKEFKRWVTSKVLPSIRKTGQYSVELIKPSLTENLEAICIILKAAHIEKNQLALALDKAYKAKTGESALALTETVLVADTQNQLYNPTELGNELGISAIKFNKALAYLGYQEKIDKKWEITTLGQTKGGIYLDTNKKHSDGTPVRQLKWPYKIIYDVQDVLEEVE